MNSPQGSTTLDQATYWNEGGGRRWVSNLDAVERMLQPLAEELSRLAAPLPGERVIDVGCGGGVTSRAMAQAVGPTGEVVGLDVSAVILDVARARHAGLSQLRFVLGDAASVELPNAQYDLIASRFGVMFFPAPVAAFAHLRSLLRPEGRLRFICWQPLVLNPWMGVPADAAFTVLPRPAPSAPNTPGPFGLANQDFLRGVLLDAGFTGLEIERHTCALDLGPLDDAVEQMTRMGPAAPLFDEADAAAREKVVMAIREALLPSLREGRVWMDSNTWKVSARA
jgi:SAM-dependent methyltransferase